MKEEKEKENVYRRLEEGIFHRSRAIGHHIQKDILGTTCECGGCNQFTCISYEQHDINNSISYC